MTAIILFNGIRFPFPVAEKAIAWAKQNKADILGIFIRSADEVKEGYVFPSDLDAAEDLADEQDTENANVVVIQKNISILKTMADSDDVPCTTQVIIDPGKEELRELMTNRDRVFADDQLETPGVMKSTHIDLKDLIKKTDIEVDIVRS